jgi:Ca2+-binding RTX toxin-like protein
MRRAIVLLATMALTLLVASGVAWAVIKVGGPGPDTLMGTKGPDTLAGRGSSDWIDGRAGKDVINGGPGDDDPLSPAIGNLIGGSGADIISGGSGGDLMDDGGDSAVDILYGGGGNDFIISSSYNRPAARDIVSCGAGRDFASVDPKDIVRNDCERVRIS